MKFNTVATAVSAAMLAGVARAEEEPLTEPSSVAPELPTFTVSLFPALRRSELLRRWQVVADHSRHDLLRTCVRTSSHCMC
jgi:predicted ATPase